MKNFPSLLCLSALLLTGALINGCGSEATDTDSSDANDASDEGDKGDDTTPTPDAAGGDDENDDGGDDTAPGSGGRTGQPPTSSGGSGSVSTSFLPCDVQQLLSSKCVECHKRSSYPMNTPEQVQNLSYAIPFVLDFDDPENYSPMPRNGPELSSAEKRILLDWVDAGVPVLSTAPTCP